ncbi:hypothetical protein CANCADRAFT_30282 [Tortispora caseinolytica NRRL Y-17796]|uniref:ML-like domain-containing protein n=1 Tax=Tortispora caseinolytica NRRL Y-17796 TaxID=767744 RepID=A0A1E4TJT3_9ASCO|nr:hypothetical protein CANCADRAFT_30282 [Tortispora caseinolytica NRRL Y-17796]
MRLHFLSSAIVGLFAVPALAAQMLRSGSLSTCMDNSGFTASEFEFELYRNNGTLDFSVQAISTISGYVYAKVIVTAYGLDIITRVLNPCNEDFVQLCPATPGTFDLTSTYNIEESLLNQIPGIAYTIPDLDGVVTVEVYNGTTANDIGNKIACVRASLSNTKTVYQPVVGWVTAVISGIALISSGIFGAMGHSSTAANIAATTLALFGYFQSVAIVNMEAVERVPPIASAWAQNFIWSLGIVRVTFMQNIFNWYVQATGGTPSTLLRTQRSVLVQKKLTKRFVEEGVSLVRRAIFVRDDEDNDGSSSTSLASALILHGIRRISYKAGIEVTNFFLTGMVFLLFVIFCIVLVMLLTKLFLELMGKREVAVFQRFYSYRNNWKAVLKGVMFRMTLLAFPQTTILCFWEFMSNDSPACIVFAVILLVISCALLFWGSFMVFKLARKSIALYKNPAYILYSDSATLNRWGFLYTPYRARNYYFIIILLGYILVKSAFISFGQSVGKVQGIAVFIIEIAYLITVCVLRPYLSRGLNIISICMQVVNTLNALFYFFFSDLMGQPAIVNSVMGVIFFVLNAAFSLILLITVIVMCCWAYFSKNPDSKYAPMRDDRASFIKDDSSRNLAIEGGTELDALGATARGEDFSFSQKGFTHSDSVAGSWDSKKSTRGFK